MDDNFVRAAVNISFAVAYLIIAIYSFYSNLIYASKEIKRKSPPLIYSAKYIVSCFLSICIVLLLLSTFFACNGLYYVSLIYGRQIDEAILNFYLSDLERYTLGFSNVIIWSAVAYYYRQTSKNKFKKIKNIYCIFESLISLELITCCTILITSTSQMKFSFNKEIDSIIVNGLIILLSVGLFCVYNIETRSMKSLAYSKEEILRVLDCPSKTSKTVLFTMRSISRSILSISILSSMCLILLISYFIQKYISQTITFFIMNFIIFIVLFYDVLKIKRVVTKSMVQTKMEE